MVAESRDTFDDISIASRQAHVHLIAQLQLIRVLFHQSHKILQRTQMCQRLIFILLYYGLFSRLYSMLLLVRMRPVAQWLIGIIAQHVIAHGLVADQLLVDIHQFRVVTHQRHRSGVSTRLAV